MKLAGKLLLPQLLLLSLLLAGSAALFLHVREREQATAQAAQQLVRANAHLGEIREQYAAILLNVLAYRQDRRSSRLDAIARAELEVSRALDGLTPLVRDARGLELARPLTEARLNVQAARNDFLRSVQSGDAAAIDRTFARWQLQRDLLDASLNDLTAQRVLLLDENAAALARREARFLGLAAVSYLLAFAIVFGSLVHLRHRVAAPLMQLTAGLDAMAPNRLGARLDRGLERNGDELGRLARAFNGMADRLQLYYMAVEREHAERELAQAELRKAHDHLEERVRARTAELAETNRSLEAEIEERKRVEQDLEAFSYSVSHDLRAPLRAVHGYASILVEDCAGQLAAADRQHLQRILANAERMDALIRALLDFARLGRRPLQMARFRLGDLVADCLEELRPEMEGRNVELQVAELPECEGDPLLMRQVLMNLLSNALKYTRGRDPARVEVGCEMRDGTGWCFVRDNGAGFDMKYADKLFGVFQRLHRAEEFEGTGVGLATVKRICERHGGRIFAEAEPGQGASFYFTCPGAGNESGTAARPALANGQA